MLSATVFADDPRPQHPGWAMAHVLRMTAGKVSNPILLLILMKTDDRR